MRTPFTCGAGRFSLIQTYYLLIRRCEDSETGESVANKATAAVVRPCSSLVAQIWVTFEGTFVGTESKPIYAIDMSDGFRLFGGLPLRQLRQPLLRPAR